MTGVNAIHEGTKDTKSTSVLFFVRFVSLWSPEPLAMIAR